jgi:cytochrome bd-type quinol oxidase subunit 2
VLVLAVDEGVRFSVPLHVSGAQGTFYSAVAGVAATLLGFLLAGVALVAALPTSLALIARARAEGQLRSAVTDLTRATLASAVTVLVALAGLVVDPQPGAPETRHHLSASALWVWIVLGSLIPTIAWLLRSVRAVANAAESSTDPAGT